MANPEAVKYVSGIAVHWYIDFIYPPSALSLTHEDVPELFILYTEACEGYQAWEKPVILGSWQRFESYVKNIVDVSVGCHILVIVLYEEIFIKVAFISSRCCNANKTMSFAVIFIDVDCSFH